MFLKKFTYLLLFSLLIVTCNFAKAEGVELINNNPHKEDTLKAGLTDKQSKLDSDEGIKCTRAELLEREFVVIGDNKYGEILRLTFQDLERGAREIIFQKKIMENDEVKFYMPNDLIKEANTAVLIVMKGSKMYFKKIDLTDDQE